MKGTRITYKKTAQATQMLSVKTQDVKLLVTLATEEGRIV